jgi:hypothetical protein
VTWPKEIACDDSLKKSPSCIRSLENWLLISTYSHLAHQTRSCWIKRENLHKNEMTVVILKLNDERKKKEILVMYFYCDLVADKKWRIIRKKNQHLFTPLHHQLSNNLFGLQTIGENQISVVSLSFWTKTWTVIIHPRPKTATPVFSPSRKIKSKYKKKICLRLWSISVNFCFCLSYSLVFQNNPQPPFFVSLSTYNFSLSFLSLAFTP